MLSTEKRDSEKGASGVEFALVLPILILLLFGIIEGGVLFYNKQVITNASREGARAGIARIADENSIKKIVVDYCKNRLITFDPALPDPIVIPQNIGGAFQTDLTITVTYAYKWFLFNQLVGLVSPFDEWEPQTTIVAKTVMKMEQDTLTP